MKFNTSCNKNAFILSQEPLPNKNCYFEINKHGEKDCYSSFGVCLKRDDTIRNGENQNGWAVRLYGSHSDLTFTGSIHNSNK